MRKRRIAITALAAVGMALVSSFAWACTRQSTILALGPPASASPGERINLQGAAAPGGLVRIHWNNPSGPVVGEAPVQTDGSYAATATIPEVGPGVYFIVSKDAEGDVARHAVQVTGVNAPTSSISSGGTQTTGVANDLWSGFQSARSNFGSTQSADASRNADAGMGIAVGMSLFSVSLTGLTAVGTAALLGRRARLGRRS